MGGGVPKIGHAPPDNKAPQRCRGEGHTNAGQSRAYHKIIHHYSTTFVCWW